VNIGEDLGLLFAINWVHDLQLEEVDFALESRIVIDYFHKEKNNITEFSHI
jgi:hypothetical protein